MKKIAALFNRVVTRYSKGVVLFLLMFCALYIVAVTVLQYITGIEPSASTNDLVKTLCCSEFIVLGLIKGVDTVSEKIQNKNKGDFRG